MAVPHQFDIMPHVGIGPVALGATPEAVEAAVGTLERALPRFDKGRTTRCYFETALQVSFGISGLVEFIGVSDSMSLLCLYEGRDVFDLPGTALFALIASREQGGGHTYDPSEYLFPDQILTLYEAAEQYDRRGGGSRPVFGQVGVGNAEYLSAVQAIHAGRSGPGVG
jgi:hypothetical protein